MRLQDLSSFPSLRSVPLRLRIKRFLPRSLFGRTLLIVVAPTFIMLAVATYVFFDRHWYTVTQRMTHALSGDIAFIVDLLQKSSNPQSTAEVLDMAVQKMDLTVRFAPGQSLPSAPALRGPIAIMLKHELNRSLSNPYVLDMRYAPETIGIYVGVPEGVYMILSPERRIYTPTTQVFILWMTGSSILLTSVALLFMRNQIRPVRRLAEAADSIGKGREVPWFKIEGASEVRQAGAALLVMRERLKRQITQRTAMLAGVSHDLRTPLTRMKLQIALMGASDGLEELSGDIAEMEEMLNAYLAFARGEEGESAVSFDLKGLLEESVTAARRQNGEIVLNVPSELPMIARRNALKRAIGNLLGNALRYGNRAEVSVLQDENGVSVIIDDDGPGIPPDRREDMFRPFTRLEESRNTATGGVGLGLTIARDIARFHGGDVILEDSSLGGLRARIWIPV